MESGTRKVPKRSSGGFACDRTHKLNLCHCPLSFI